MTGTDRAGRSAPDDARAESGETVEVARLPLPAYVWKHLDGVLQLVDCNAAARDLEPAVDQLMGLTIEDLEESEPQIARNIRRALAQRTVVTEDGAYRRRGDGATRWLTGTYVYAPPGKVIVHVDDATERRREERILRESNQRIRAAFEKSPLGKILVSIGDDAPGRVIEVNDAFCRLVGQPRERLVGQVMPADFSHPDDARVGVAAVQRLVAREVSSCHFEKRFVRAGGEVFTASVWVSLVDGTEGGHGYALWHFQDVTQSKEAEAALRTSEERYRQIVETTSEGVWTIDARDQTTFVNARMAQMLGYEVEEMIGRPIADFVAGDAPDVPAKLANRRRGVAEQHETQLRRKDGSALWVSISNDSLPADHGEYVGALALVSDITERKRAEAALHEAKALFEGAFEHAPIGVALVDLGKEAFGRVMRANSAICDLLGYDESELVGRRFAELTHPDDVDRDVANAHRLSTGEIDAYESEKRYVTAGGDVVLARLSASIIPNAVEGVTFGIAHIEDVSERRRAQGEIEERERRFRAAFDMALDAMLIADDDRIWLQGNRAASALLGLDQDAIPGTRLEEIAVADGDVDEWWNRFLRDGEMTGELDVRRADGDVRHVEFSARANFTPGRHLAILRDVTERKRAEAARERSREEAERLEEALHQAQKLDTVGQLAGGVAHDFNNLLAVIMHASEFALTELDGHPAAEEVREIRAAADRAAALTRQLLVFSRREIAQPRLLDLNELATSVERLLRRTIGEHIELTTALDPALPFVRADPNQLEQVLLNLAVNARDAMPEGGTLCVETATVELDAEYARLHLGVQPGTYVRLAVSDTGRGMTPEVRERAFEPFFTTKPKGAGTGLGLATTYGIVKQNGGHVEIYSEPGAGTVMKVYLPAAPSRETQGHGGDEPAVMPSGAGELILVVEDEEGVRRVTERILRAGGYEVLAASGPQEALELAAGAQVDLVLTDVVMPVMSGAALVERLRQDAERLPAIFMSGYTDRPGALPSDAAFLSKPFSRQSLLEQVARALGETDTTA
jgi:two-component system, cell cycle sensor histidine kinase and response regulator CckA